MAQGRIRLVLLFAIIAVYAAVRLFQLDASCLWFDEIFSVQAAEHGWGDIFRFIALDLVHPPLFYLVLKLWIAVGGEGIFWLRLLSVVFACASILPFMLTAGEIERNRRADDEKDWTGVFALFLLAVNGSLIKYSQEVRMYTMLMFLGLLSIWLFARYFYRGKSWIWLVIANVLLVYTHYYGWLVICSELLAILVFQRMKWRRIMAMGGIVFAAFVPWIVAVYNASRAGNDIGQNIAWIERPGLRTLFEFALKQIEPFYFSASNAEPVSTYSISVPLLLLVLIALVLPLAIPKKAEDGRVRLPLVFAIVPLIAAVTLSWLLPYSVWGSRHMIVIAAPLSMLIAILVLGIPNASLRTAAITLIILFSGYAAYLRVTREPPSYVWCGWEELLADVKPAGGPVTIYASEDLVAFHAWFATRDQGGYRIGLIKGGDILDDGTYFVPRGFEGIRKGSVDDISEQNVILLYRTEPPLLKDWLFQSLRERGYTACPSRVLEYGPSTALRVEMSRDGNCIYPF